MHQTTISECWVELNKWVKKQCKNINYVLSENFHKRCYRAQLREMCLYSLFGFRSYVFNLIVNVPGPGLFYETLLAVMGFLDSGIFSSECRSWRITGSPLLLFDSSPNLILPVDFTLPQNNGLSHFVSLAQVLVDSSLLVVSWVRRSPHSSFKKPTVGLVYIFIRTVIHAALPWDLSPYSNACVTFIVKSWSSST